MSKNYKKFVFTDIDGTLAGYEYLKKGKGFIDPEIIKLLNRLKDINAEIVISSSWGYDNGRTEKALKDVGLELPIIGYTQHIRLNYPWACRGNEIEKWIYDKCNKHVTQFGDDYYNKIYCDDDIDYEYVILDDDSDMLLGQVEHFINVNRERSGIFESEISVGNQREFKTEFCENFKPVFLTAPPVIEPDFSNKSPDKVTILYLPISLFATVLSSTTKVSPTA